MFDITEEEYVNTPSRKDGIDEETESKLRIYGCELVQECGVLLRLYVLSHPPRASGLWTAVENLTKANRSQASSHDGHRPSDLPPLLFPAVVQAIRRTIRVAGRAISCSEN